jgi:hypothetical protein
LLIKTDYPTQSDSAVLMLENIIENGGAGFSHGIQEYFQQSKEAVSEKT